MDTDVLIDRSPDALMLPFVDYSPLNFDGSSPDTLGNRRIFGSAVPLSM